MGRKSMQKDPSISAMRKIETELFRLEETDRKIAESLMLLQKPPGVEERREARTQGRCAVEGRLQDIWLLSSERSSRMRRMEKLRLEHARIQANLGVLARRRIRRERSEVHRTSPTAQQRGI